MIQLKVKYLFPNIPELISADGDSGYDIRAAIDKPLTVEPAERVSVPTGIMVEVAGIPNKENCSVELQVRPRSGLTKRGLIAQFGTIDASYRGEIWITLINASKDNLIVEPLDRIAQLVVCPIYKPQVVKADVLSVTARGAKGFGSSGRR